MSNGANVIISGGEGTRPCGTFGKDEEKGDELDKANMLEKNVTGVEKLPMVNFSRRTIIKQKRREDWKQTFGNPEANGFILAAGR